MPDQILIAFFPELRLYGLWGDKGHFAELLKILEKEGATGRVATHVAVRWDRTGMAEWAPTYEGVAA